MSNSENSGCGCLLLIIVLGVLAWNWDKIAPSTPKNNSKIDSLQEEVLKLQLKKLQQDSLKNLQDL